jgi:TonB-dependent SusC/RagA subfamily outer membrane receptor
MVAFPTAARRLRFFAAVPLATLLAVGAPLAALSQEPGELTGRVTFAGNGQGVPGALVTLHEAGLGVLTDRNGRYQIRDVPVGQHFALTVLMGCILTSHPVQVEAGRRASLDISLQPPVIDLEGIVATASSISSDRAELPFAVARLEAGERDEIATGSTRSVGSMLQGKVAGARVVQGSGQPGTDPSILLRGPTSLLGSQQPLIVIDGVITQGRLTDIDPFDVARVEVLKGASAAASYGSRGQAGVIEITTKRGPAAEAPRNPRQPVLLLDGVVTEGTLSDLNLAEVADIRRLEGPVAAVLYGVGAERGAIEVTTLSGPPPGVRPFRPACLTPTE